MTPPLLTVSCMLQLYDGTWVPLGRLGRGEEKVEEIPTLPLAASPGLVFHTQVAQHRVAQGVRGQHPV
jgi:hypothetical protein